MEKMKSATTARIPQDIYEKVSIAAKECGAPVGAFIADALEDVLKGYEAKSAIMPRCIAKAAAHQSDPVVKSNSGHSGVHVGRSGKTFTKQPIRQLSP